MKINFKMLAEEKMKDYILHTLAVQNCVESLRKSREHIGKQNLISYCPKDWHGEYQCLNCKKIYSQKMTDEEIAEAKSRLEKIIIK